MAECPSCSVRLVQRQTPNGVVYICPTCGGRTAALAVLRHAQAEPAFLRDLWQKTIAPDAPRVRRCPHCGQRMSQVAASRSGRPLALDVCKLCASVWFDPAEFERVPRPPAAAEKPLSAGAREKVALLKLASMKESEESGAAVSPDHAWQWLPALFGLPVEWDAPGVSRRPWITWGLILACVLASVSAIVHSLRPDLARDTAAEWGFIPAQWGRHGGLTMITSFFLHGGAFHLLSNMYFLAVFGDNVEDNLGRWGYAVLLASAHGAGLALHGALDPRSGMALVGASGGISGVIAYYAITFPDVRLGILWRIYFYFRWMRIPAWAALVIFILLQFIGAWFQVRGFSNVSALGHLGGLAVGIAAAAAAHVERGRSRADALGDAAVAKPLQRSRSLQ